MVAPPTTWWNFCLDHGIVYELYSIFVIESFISMVSVLVSEKFN